MTWERDLGGYIDRFGSIAVDVRIGGGPGTAIEARSTGASSTPAVVAQFLRELADDVERAGQAAVVDSSDLRKHK